MRWTAASFFHLLPILFPAAAPANESPPVMYRDGPQVSHAALLARNDVVYLSPAVHEHEAMPVGNGTLCGMVSSGDGIDVQVNHAGNVWHQNASGRVHLRTGPPMTAGSTRFEQRLSLHDGSVRVKYAGKAGDWQATVTALDGMDVLAIHLEGKLRGDTIRLELHEWRPSALPVVRNGFAGFVEDLAAPGAAQFSRKMALAARADCPMAVGPMRQEGLLRIIPIVLSPKRDARGFVRSTIYLANPVVAADADAEAYAAALLLRAEKTGWDSLAAAEAKRWARFWERSFLYLSSPDGVAEYMENLWFLHLYWMGCGGDGPFAVKFNGGPFLVHRDSRSWGTSYWYQNTRELYWPLPVANHLELCGGLKRLYLSNLPSHRKHAGELFGKRGLQVQETMAISGDGDKRGNPYTMLYLSTGLECALQLFHQAAFARDDDSLRREVLPFMKEAVEFFMEYATLGSDGRYHVRPEDARETYWRVQDSMTTISALREALPILVRESRRLGVDAALRPRWEDFLRRLAPLPERPDGKGYAACIVPATIPASANAIVNRLYSPENTSTRWDRRFNSENVELDCIYPFGLVGIGAVDHAKAVAAYEGRPFLSSYGWDWSPVCAARLGFGEEAGRILAEHCRNTQHWPQGFWDSPSSPYWAGGLVDCPYFDSSGVNAAATTEMLLQSHGGIIRVWPAVPASWSGAFRLRAETGFMVTSERSGGAVRYVAVESLFGGPCRLVSPWNARWRVTCRNKTIVEGEASEIAFPTENRRAYLVELVAAPVHAMPFRRLEPEQNNDVKYMANARRTRRPLAPTPGLPMLGITRSGLTPARAAAEESRTRAAEAIRRVVGDRKARTGLKAQWLDAAGKAAPAPWISDGKYGAATIPLPRAPACGYLLELPAELPISAVVWSYDRNGQRQDMEGQARELRIECSQDGKTWRDAVGQPVQVGDRHGKAVSLPYGAKARYVRLRFLDAAGRPGVVSCDEIEVF